MPEFKTIKGNDYHRHNGLWVPEDLQVGDIIRCRMLTKYTGIDQPEMCNRNVMVLGMEMDLETLEYTSIHVARFSYSLKYCTDDVNFLVPRHMERRGLVTGLTDQASLNANHTDFVPLTQDHFWSDVYDVQRIGKVDPSLFAEIRETMERGHRLARTHSRLPNRDLSKWYVPGAHLVGENILSPHHSHEFTKLEDFDTARIHVDWALRKDPNKLDADFVTRCLSEMEHARIKLIRQQQWEMRHRKKPSVHEPHAKDIISSGNKSTLITAPEEEVDNTFSPDEQFTMFLPHASDESMRGMRALAARFNEHAQAPYSKIELPAHLWQGRYMMVKIHDLHDEENDGNAYRPCAVWKAYADRDTNELVGLELHPVTRGSVNTFKYRFQVYPLKTESKRPGHLIADCIIRVPLTERYFHEKNSSSFFEIPPDKLEKFKQRREHALNSGDPVHVYGLKEIPENWIETELDPTPSFQQFLKWSENGKIRFDGTINDKAREHQRHQTKPHQGPR